MVPIAYFFLPDTPDKARFLTEEEKVGSIQPPTDKFIVTSVGNSESSRCQASWWSGESRRFGLERGRANASGLEVLVYSSE